MTKHIPLSAELLHGRPVSCEARREGDEFACACGKRWAVDDAEPPTCARARHIFSPTPATVAARQESVRPPEPVKERRLPLPEELTLDQLGVMHAVMTKAYQNECNPYDGMRAAYRALLDSLDR